MLNLLRQMTVVLREERGLETLEWIFMGFLVIVTIATAVYGPGGGTISAAMGTAVTAVAAAL